MDESDEKDRGQKCMSHFRSPPSTQIFSPAHQLRLIHLWDVGADISLTLMRYRLVFLLLQSKLHAIVDGLTEEILSEQAYGIFMIDISLGLFLHSAPSFLPFSALSVFPF